MKPIILFRSELDTEKEELSARKFFEVTTSRVGIQDRLVIGRYSCLPFYKELEADLLSQGSRLVNSWRQHSFVADFDYYEVIEDLTPKTYFRLSDLRDVPGPFVVKGCTNSRKHQWSSMMFAENFERAVEISLQLGVDSLIQTQRLIYREFEKLRTFYHGIGGIPITNEWRVFFFKNHLLSCGYYWSDYHDEVTGTGALSFFEGGGLDSAQKAADRLQEHVNFFAVDVAEKEDGSWIVIEVNDGQMSGLSKNCPETLYGKLFQALE